jgi:hypothetical protein
MATLRERVERMRHPLAVCGLVVLLAGPSSAAGLDPAITGMLESLALPVPNPPHVLVCHGFSCTYRTEVGFGPADRTRLQALMAAGRASPAAERQAIGAAYAWFERRVAPEAGTAQAVARTTPLSMRDPAQFDCFDKTHNATELLALLAHFDLLRHHVVDVPQSRGVPVILQHTTAVIRETVSGSRWSVDGWTRNNGEVPDIFPMEYWAAQN